MDYTTRLALRKPDPDPVTGDFVDVDDLNANADKLDGVVSFTVCTSSARPAVPFAGQGIIETDTGRMYTWGGSAWIPLLGNNSLAQVAKLSVGSEPVPTATGRLVHTYGAGGSSVSQVLLRTSGTATGNRALSVMGGADVQDRWWVDFDGNMQWGPGSAGGDTALYRSASGVLRTDAAFNVAGDYLTAANAGVNGPAVTSGTNTTTSASYVNLTGTGSQTSVSITKRFPASRSRLKVYLSANMWVSGSFPTAVMFGALVNGSDTDIFRHQIDASAGNNNYGQGTSYIAGLAAGTYTVQGRWKRVSGTGTPTRDINNWLTLMVEEVSI